MKLAADFRYIAKEALRGKWGIAVIAGLIASYSYSARISVLLDGQSFVHLLLVSVICG